MHPNRWSITNMKVWRCSCRVDLFFFPLACGDSGYSQHRFFSEEVSCCKWKLSIGFIYPLFLFSAHLLLFLSPVSSVISSKRHYVFFPFCCPCFFPSIPLFCSLIFFLSLSFPFCCCPSPPPSLVYLSSAVGTTRQTGQYICIATQSSASHCTARSYQWNRSALSPPSLSIVSSTSSLSSSSQELPSTACSRIIESSIDRMGNIDSLHCSILFLLSTTPPPPFLLTCFCLSLSPPVTLTPSPCFSFLLWSQLVTAVIRCIDNSTTPWSIFLVICPCVCLLYTALLMWPRGRGGGGV